LIIQHRNGSAGSGAAIVAQHNASRIQHYTLHDTGGAALNVITDFCIEHYLLGTNILAFINI